MAAPKLRTEAARAGKYPEKRFNQRERKLLESVSNAARAGKHTTTANAVQTISVPGATAADVAIVTMQTEGAVPVTVKKAVAGTDSITVTLSGNPSTDHILCWALLQA